MFQREINKITVDNEKGCINIGKKYWDAYNLTHGMSVQHELRGLFVVLPDNVFGNLIMSHRAVACTNSFIPAGYTGRLDYVGFYSAESYDIVIRDYSQICSIFFTSNNPNKLIIKEIENIEVSSTKRRVYTEQGDPEIDSLYRKYKDGDLIIQPDFQRHFVWDAKKSSRLIESALLDIPLPVIYLSEEKDGKEYVIDGQQRLTAFFSFYRLDEFPDGIDFKLTGLKVFTELNRKSFKEIDRKLQNKIRYCKIRTITFRRESEADLKFEIFERLNTGAVSLNDQELRNCIYRGLYKQITKRTF